MITLFVMLEWDRYGFDKKRTGTRYAQLIFLRPVGSVGHVAHSNASGARNVNALFFMLVWARCGFHQKCTETHCAELVFLHPVGSAGKVVHSGVSGE
jgi:hypothetical protein